MAAASHKEKKTFNDLDDQDCQIFMDYTKISLRQAKEIFQEVHAKYPDGKLDRAHFADFYKRIDPDSCKLDNYSKFTDMIFNSFDSDKSGLLTVKEVLVGFAVITKGEPDKRLEYIFNLYDLDSNGALSKEEIKEGFRGVFIMGGVDANEFMCDVSANNKIKKLDVNADGKITKQEFIETIKKNKKFGDGLFFM